VKFFEVVDHLKPRFWAMENVPRVEQVIREGMATRGHPLHRFRHLAPEIDVFDFSDYGAPQARRRCIATNLPLSGIKAFISRTQVRTLGDVVRSLATAKTVVDPVWGVTLPSKDLTETQVEPPLQGEELRMNREAKEHHPVYNNMAFPDPLDRPARTVTATCTRVSRESIVIADPRRPAEFRRLTIRERASLQGFPITYQFFAKSFAEKAKMIGNAIPPTFTHLLALMAKGLSADDFQGFKAAGETLGLPALKAPVTPPDKEGRSYPAKRGFRAALPGFRFKSGMRFDLSNSIVDGAAQWTVRFYYGPSKDIRQIELDGAATETLRQSEWFSSVLSDFRGELARARSWLAASDPQSLQEAWTRRAAGMGPFEVTDKIAELAESLHARLEAEMEPPLLEEIEEYVVDHANGDDAKMVGRSKLEKYALRVLAGIVVSEWFNTLDWHCERRAAA
jgi:DNA (cytosine-5)-methyltransferase 1